MIRYAREKGPLSARWINALRWPFPAALRSECQDASDRVQPFTQLRLEILDHGNPGRADMLRPSKCRIAPFGDTCQRR